MDKEPVEPENSAQVKASEAPNVRPTVPGSIPDGASSDAPSKFSAASLTSWAKNLKITQPQSPAQDDQPTDNAAKLTFARFTSGLGLRLSPKAPQQDDSSGSTSPASQPGLFGTLTKGIVDTSKNAAKAVQVKARHAVSQNKRRYQEGGFDLDMTYITENIIAMGFPAGDMSSGFFGYVEGLYRNHMDEVIKFFETNHKDKYKVYNLCSERLYDASLFEGKVASFPFDDHNCPPIQLIISFCQSAYSWLKQDIENVVVVHCKAGMARTGLMISSLLLFLKFFPTAEESIDYYNQKRCMDSKGLVLPSQIRYVKYFERTMTYFNGENQPGRRCMLRGFRLHRCPYWIRPSISVSDHNGVLFSSKKHTRTKDLSPEEFWFTSPKKGIMVFALPGEPGLTELCGDFKVHFHDGQGDFYCRISAPAPDPAPAPCNLGLNTTMMENRKILNTADLDGFDKRKLPSPGFQVEVVLADYDGTVPMAIPRPPIQEPDGTSNTSLAPIITNPPSPKPDQDSESQDKDDVFSDSEADESSSSKSKKTQPSPDGASTTTTSTSDNKTKSEQMTSSAHQTENVSSKNIPEDPKVGSSVAQEVPSSEMSEFKAMAADASVFSFGDDEDYESD